MLAKPTIEVCLSPALLHLYDTKDTVVVIIDIFRASSTIVAALHNGAKQIIPVASVEECIAMKAAIPGCITAGERDGKIAPGLEHGNSPLEYPRSFIEDKVLALTTTNGTKLLHMVQEADQIIIGSFLNLQAICDYLIRQNKKVLLGCAAWKDRVNLEDSLFAGAVVEQLRDHFSLNCDSARMAALLYREARQHQHLIDFLRDSSHYRRLSAYGLVHDMEYCTTPDQHPVVPVYNGNALVCGDQ